MFHPTDTPPPGTSVAQRSRRHARLLLGASLLLVLAAAAALWVDVPLGQWCVTTFSAASGGRPPHGSPWWLGLLAQVLRFAEVFGHGVGVTWIVLAIFLLDPIRRWTIPRLLTVTIASGLMVDVFKGAIVRTRPNSFDFAGSVGSTFGAWLPLWSVGSTGQSLPSGHTGTAVGLAIALVWAYPRGRWLFPVLALLVACQRVQAGAHWLSDVLAGGVVGCLVALVCLDVGPIPRAFNRWEAVWKARDEERERKRAETGRKMTNEES